MHHSSPFNIDLIFLENKQLAKENPIFKTKKQITTGAIRAKICGVFTPKRPINNSGISALATIVLPYISFCLYATE